MARAGPRGPERKAHRLHRTGYGGVSGGEIDSGSEEEIGDFELRRDRRPQTGDRIPPHVSPRSPEARRGLPQRGEGRQKRKL